MAQSHVWFKDTVLRIWLQDFSYLYANPSKSLYLKKILSWTGNLNEIDNITLDPN